MLGEIYAQGLEAAGFTVEKQLNLGDEKTALKALEGKEIDAYPEYTGTALLSFFDVKASEIPKDPSEAFDQAKIRIREEKASRRSPPTPFTSSNEVGLTKEKADELGVKKISDLAGKDQDLTLYGSPECRQRDGLPARPAAGLRPGVQEVHARRTSTCATRCSTRARPTCRSCSPPTRRSSATGTCCSRTTRACSRRTTRRSLVRATTSKGAGRTWRRWSGQVQKGLTDEVMQELNARVDLDKKTPEAVAGEYLKESGLVN